MTDRSAIARARPAQNRSAPDDDAEPDDDDRDDAPAGAGAPALEPPAPRKRGRPRVGDKRRQILDAALGMFAAKGFHGTAVPEVADAAGVGAGTLYRYFASKEDLVNEVFRDAKGRLGAALYGARPPAGAPPLPPGVGAEPDPARAWFLDVWSRLVWFARNDRPAFQFLEMQDHVPYLDPKSKEVEMVTLAPLWLATQELARRGETRDLPPEVLMAFAWGAFVGVLKAERLGYFTVDDSVLMRVGEACWDAFVRKGRG